MKVLKIVSSLLLMFFTFLYINYFTSFVMPWQENNAIECIQLWGGLSHFPKDYKIISIRKYGSDFTRQYKIEFTSSENEIKKWILESKRLKNNRPKVKGLIREFKIYPGELESYGGEVKVQGNKVSISMSWS